MSSLQHLKWVAEDLVVLSRFQSVLAKLRHRELAGEPSLQMPWSRLSRKMLPAYLLLQRHESMDQGLGPRWTTRYMHVHRDVAVDAFQHVIAIAKGAPGDSAGSHGDHVFRFRHLVVQPNHLGSHLLGYRSGNNHEIGLSR